MLPENRDSAYVWDMLDAAKYILLFTQDKSYQDYSADFMLQAAVERKIEIMGEAARRISQPFKDEHPEIPWNRIIAQRNVLAHEYGEIKQDKIWMLVQNNIPALAALLAKLIPPLPDN